jgi:hypothetical protein
MDSADDQRVAASIGEELTDGVAHRASGPEPTEDVLVLCEALHVRGLVAGSAVGEADESGDRSRDACDRADAARDLLDVDAGIGRCGRHSALVILVAGGSPLHFTPSSGPRTWVWRLSNSTSQRQTAASLCSALEAAEETGSTRHEQSLTSRGRPYYRPEPTPSTVIVACRTSAKLPQLPTDGVVRVGLQPGQRANEGTRSPKTRVGSLSEVASVDANDRLSYATGWKPGAVEMNGM